MLLSKLFRVSVRNRWGINVRHWHDFKEIKIPVPWGHMAAKQWGDPKLPYIVCLHGYMDNCNSFDRLIPLLPNKYCYVAVDWPGHGHSSHIPHGHFYSNEFYIWAIEKTRRYLKADKIGIISHSMGAGFAVEYVQNILDVTYCIVCFDTIAPPHNPMIARLHHIERRVDEMIAKEKWQERPRTKDQFIQALMTGYNGTINKGDAELLIERGTKPSGDFLLLRRDPKVQNNSVIGERDDLLYTPTPSYQNLHWCLIQYKAGMIHSSMAEFRKLMQLMVKYYGPVEYHVMEGRHCEHLKTPEPTAQVLDKFLNKVAKEVNI